MANRLIRKNRGTYSYLKDPHLFYHLESPVKIQQLLQSGLYELDGNRIIQIETLQSLELSPFTLAKIPAEIKEKHQQPQIKQDEENTQTEEQAMKKSGGEKSNSEMQKNSINFTNSNLTPYQVKLSSIKSNKKSKQNLQVKGLKEFEGKIL